MSLPILLARSRDYVDMRRYAPGDPQRFPLEGASQKAESC